jgi:integrase
MNSGPANPADIDAARLLLSRLGVSVEDLLGKAVDRPEAPTFTDYIPKVSAAVSAGTRRVSSSYWNKVLAAWADRRLDEVTSSEIAALAEHTRTHVVVRRSARGGGGAAKHLIAALRCLYKHAINDGLIGESDNPAIKVPKPRRQPSIRRGLADDRVAEIVDVASTTGDDQALDALMLRLHIETACRRGGALTLSAKDLDPHQCLILLHEKAETQRWQPVSPTLMTHLQAHMHQRGGDHGGPILRYANGKPITKRRYDYIWRRLGEHLPWVETQQISAHWLRHTTLTWVERNFGYAVARAYAGHTGSADAGTTTTYVRATIHEVATALAALTNEPHPLAIS